MSDTRIVFLQRGNVIVGRFKREGLYCSLEGGAVVHRWGTKNLGIGHIAEHGPTGETVLYGIPEVTYHQLTEVMNIECNDATWAKHIRPLGDDKDRIDPALPDTRIAFLQRGNVIVGTYQRDGLYCSLEGGSVLHRWGTKGLGIGHIAFEGPTAETVLYPIPKVEWHQLTEVMTIRCHHKPWMSRLRKPGEPVPLQVAQPGGGEE